MQTRNYILSVTLFVLSSFDLAAQTDSTTLSRISIWQQIDYTIDFGLMTYEKGTGKKAYNATLSASVVYHLHQLIQPGLTIGYDEYNEFAGMPVLVTLNGDLKKSKNTPIYYFRAGYTHFFLDQNSRYDEIQGGRLIELALGYAWTFDKVRLRLSTGWRRQLLKTEGWGYNYSFGGDALFSSFAPPSYQKTDWRMDRVVFKVGLEF